MRGELSRNSVNFAEGEVTFHESIPWSGKFEVCCGDVNDVGDYMLTLDDGRTHKVKVYSVHGSTSDDTLASFTIAAGS
jgi:hypothetical protein